MKYQRINFYHGKVLTGLLLIGGIAVGMNASVVLAQHEPMRNHENMSPGEHAKHQAQEDAEKISSPESENRTEESKPDPKKPEPDPKKPEPDGHQHKTP